MLSHSRVTANIDPALHACAIIPAVFVGWFMTEQPEKGLKKPLSDLGYIWMFTIATIAGLIMAGVAAVLYVK
jgi:hypothetical protein